MGSRLLPCYRQVNHGGRGKGKEGDGSFMYSQKAPVLFRFEAINAGEQRTEGEPGQPDQVSPTGSARPGQPTRDSE
ncbi:hypothetical protein AB9P05_17880 [Roseivirga sp. BDSF3-8]|uniref:hypothetical protein n=1 Tax=Roseivirga sp. BDSF3-8 TaxID=3241598 RepID=UPI003531F968